MAANKALERGVAFPEPVPSTVVSGDPLLVGKLAAVAETDYSSTSGEASLSFEGAYFLSVVAKSSLSPSTGSAVKPGDAIYLTGGTLDSTTNCTTGGTLCKDSSGTFYGNALDSITSGSTATIRVRLQGKAA